jgi:hypothetical protein
MPVAVRNTEGGPTVFSIPENNVQIEWQGAGDPSGGDVQYVPDDLLTNVQFSKIVRRGILTVLAAGEGEDAMDRQVEAYTERTSTAAAAAATSIDQQVNNDLVQASCIGPSNRGQGECGEPVAVKEKDLRTTSKPVLCPRHEALAPQYARVETSNMIESGDALVPETKWVRTQVTARESSKQ